MSQDIHRHRILILDFGSQYTQLIARRVREIGVYCEIYAWDVTDADIRSFNPSGIILSGGPESVTAADSPRAPQVVFELDLPLLGICYGMQLLVKHFGGVVTRGKDREYGPCDQRFESLERARVLWAVTACWNGDENSVRLLSQILISLLFIVLRLRSKWRV